MSGNIEFNVTLTRCEVVEGDKVVVGERDCGCFVRAWYLPPSPASWDAPGDPGEEEIEVVVWDDPEENKYPLTDSEHDWLLCRMIEEVSLRQADAYQELSVEATGFWEDFYD